MHFEQAIQIYQLEGEIKSAFILVFKKSGYKI